MIPARAGGEHIRATRGATSRHRRHGPGTVRISAFSGARTILSAWALTATARRTRVSALQLTTTTNAEKPEMHPWQKSPA